MRTIFILSALIVLLDQATKFLAVQFLRPLEQIPLIPQVFHLTYIENSGIAFGLLQNFPSAWIMIISFSVVLLLIGIYFFKRQSFHWRIAYAFIVGGAIGNWIDRIRINGVIDFLDFRIWPVFNIADSFITIGVAMFLWFAMRSR